MPRHPARSTDPSLRRHRAVGLVAAMVVTVGLAAGCGSSSDGASSTTRPESSSTSRASTTVTGSTTAAGSTEVVKDVLGTEVDPPGAPGRTLTLIRYTIPPGAKLAPHIHPGVQMARITSGELTYTVVDGTALVRRSGASSDERVAAPATITLEPGDTVIERDGMVHFGANDTDQPVVIDATLLTVDGEDLAVPVSTTVP